jgi:hypothetical protein
VPIVLLSLLFNWRNALEVLQAHTSIRLTRQDITNYLHFTQVGASSISIVFKRKEADEAVQHESHEKQIPGKRTTIRIFGPENSGSIQLLMRNQLNLRQAKMGQRERIAAYPHKSPTIKFFPGWEIKGKQLF